MSVAVICCYHPVPGREAELDTVVAEHLPTLQAAGLATDRPSALFKAPNGTIIEIFEWRSADHSRRAHEVAAVAALWARFADVCSFIPLAEVPGADRPFLHLTPLP